MTRLCPRKKQKIVMILLMLPLRSLLLSRKNLRESQPILILLSPLFKANNIRRKSKNGRLNPCQKIKTTIRSSKIMIKLNLSLYSLKSKKISYQIYLLKKKALIQTITPSLSLCQDLILSNS